MRPFVKILRPLVIVMNLLFSAALDGGELVGYFNLPWFAWGSPETHLGDSEVYNSLVRVASPYDRLATAVVKLFVYYNVQTTVFHIFCILDI